MLESLPGPTAAGPAVQSDLSVSRCHVAKDTMTVHLTAPRFYLRYIYRCSSYPRREQRRFNCCRAAHEVGSSAAHDYGAVETY